MIKRPDRGLRYSWTIASWGPRFSEFLVAFADQPRHEQGEPSVGDAVQAAIETGLSLDAVTFHEGSYLDVGTAEALAKARRVADG